MAPFLHHLLQVLAALLMGPLMLGVINKTKARFAGRVGPPLLQVYFDLVKLLRKQSVISRTTTWVFVAGPAVGLVAVTFAVLLMPLGPSASIVSFAGDFVLFAYLLALARFFLTSAALDTGSAFEGMGASREVTFAAFSEIAVFFALLALSSLSRASSLSGMLDGLDESARLGATAPIVLLVSALAIVLLAENARIPVDDPNTHLELTMIHEVMVLDHGGPMLGVILYSASVKLVLLSSLLLKVALPPIADPALGWLVFVALLLLVAVVIGVIESVMARLRLARVPAMLVTSCLLAGFGFLLVVT